MKKNILIKMPRCLILVVCFFLTSNVASAVVLTTNYQNSFPRYINLSSGICVDIIDELNLRLAANKIKITPTNKKRLLPLKNILNQLSNNKIELFVGLSRSTKREEMFQYAEQPLYELSETFVKRQDNPYEYTDLQSLTGKKIVVLKASNTAQRMAAIDGVEVIEKNSVKHMLKTVAAGKADLAFYHNLGLEYAMTKTGLDNQLMLVEKPVKTKSHYLLFNKSVSTDKVKLINQFLVDMANDGTLKKILKSYVN